MAIVVDGRTQRLYIPPIEKHEVLALGAIPRSFPKTNLPEKALGFRVQAYGMTSHADLFTKRQLLALTTFSDLVTEARKRVFEDAVRAGMTNDAKGFSSGGSGALAYADAVSTYLAFTVDRLANRGSTICIWNTGGEKIEQTFARQAIPMTWDFAESNPFSESTGNWQDSVGLVAECLERTPVRQPLGTVDQLDASIALPKQKTNAPLIASDPPYYDNIGYADLSDFFYIWLRRSLANVYPELFSTVLTPKAQELIASPFRFNGDGRKAEEHFEIGLGKAFTLMRQHSNPEYPLTVYYAFKQQELGDDDGNGVTASSTGWEKMLDGLLKAGFQITATWPMRTERSGGLRDYNANALASSIVIACRPRPEDAPLATRKEFIAALRKEMPSQLKLLISGGVAPVDLTQASIGPGMAVFSRYSKVLEADGNPMSVRSALQIINQELDAYLTQEEGDLDRDTRFCLAWFEQRGMEEGPFGEAETLAKAKDIAVQGLVNSGVAQAKAGKVRLLKRDELEEGWDPLKDARLTVWESTQQLIRTLEADGEEVAGRLVARLGGGRSEEARSLAYRLFAICDKKGWSREAMAYNGLVRAWPEITRLAQDSKLPEQGRMEMS
ncbi:MAG: hypothetical protein ABR958_01740 [Dehalococcoidales bacterium]